MLNRIIDNIELYIYKSRFARYVAGKKGQQLLVNSKILPRFIDEITPTLEANGFTKIVLDLDSESTRFDYTLTMYYTDIKFKLNCFLDRRAWVLVLPMHYMCSDLEFINQSIKLLPDKSDALKEYWKLEGKRIDLLLKKVDEMKTFATILEEITYF